MIYVYGAFPLGISFANTCISFTPKKSFNGKKCETCVVDGNFFLNLVCSILFFWSKILPKMGKIKANKGNILSQYSLF
jgi:hypothetical protein